jgi:hypothetical protein
MIQRRAGFKVNSAKGIQLRRPDLVKQAQFVATSALDGVATQYDFCEDNHTPHRISVDERENYRSDPAYWPAQ